MSFFNELRRRNVFRVGIAYGLSAWVLLQGADFALDVIGAPDWIIQALAALAAIGLPAVLVFAWVFEMTPEGLKREAEIDRSQSITGQTGKKLDRVIIGILTVAVAVLLADRFIGHEPSSPAVTPSEPAAATESEKSIAVLPFVNMSSDPEQEYFSDGISEEILNSLARVRELKVAGRTSSFAFKGQNQDLRQIGEALGVNHILEGSVRKAGDQVRITAQLIQVADGFHLWSQTYDRELTDIFAIQDEIANAILEQLKAALLDAPIVSQAAANTVAYELYLLAKKNIRERTESSLQTAAAQLDRAIAADPGFAPALAQRAVAELLLSVDEYGTLPNEQTRRSARAWIDRALGLDDRLDEAWASLGLYWSQATNRGERNEGIEPLQRALTINPNLTDASNWLQGIYADQGRLQDSTAILEQTVNRDPLYRPALSNLMLRYCMTGQPAKARKVLERGKEFLIGDPIVSELEAMVLVFEARAGDALPLARESWQKLPNDSNSRFRYALTLFELGDYEAVLELNGNDFRAAALRALGRSEEATLLAYKLAASGEDLGSVFHLLGRSGRHAELVEFFEARWASLKDWKTDFPSLSGFGDMQLALMAHAYRSVGNEDRFREAMRMLEQRLGSQREQGADNFGIDETEAYFHMLAGNETLALEKLSQTIEGGGMLTPRLTNDVPVFQPLEGDPRFEAIQQRNLEIINRERAKTGMAPIELDRAR